MAEIFLSHANNDKPLVDKFDAFLQKGLGLNDSNIFYTSRDSGPSRDRDVDAAIYEDLQYCKIVIFIITDEFLSSSACIAEMGAARVLDKNVYLLLTGSLTYHELAKTPYKNALARRLDERSDLWDLRDLIQGLGIRISGSFKFETALNSFLRGRAQLSTYIEGLKSRADGGDGDACYLLGCALNDGILIRKDRRRAESLIRTAVGNKCVPAMVKLGDMYCRGDVSPWKPNFQEAFRWTDGVYKIDIDASKERSAEDKEHDEFLECPADLRCAEEYFRGATLECMVKPSRMDASELRKYYTKDEEYEYHLGLAYFYGQNGSEPDYLEAEVHFKKAAAYDKPEAQFYIGIMYQRGFGVECNWHTAVSWLGKAADQNYDRAQLELGVMYAQFDYKKGWDEAVRLFKRASELKNPVAKCHLGDAYRFGLLGLEENIDEARKYYEEASDQNNTVARLRLKDM